MIMNRRAVKVGGGVDLAVNGWAGRSSIRRRRGLSLASVQPASMAPLALASFGSRQGNAGLVAAGGGQIQGWLDPEPDWGDAPENPEDEAPPTPYSIAYYQAYLNGSAGFSYNKVYPNTFLGSPPIAAFLENLRSATSLYIQGTGLGFSSLKIDEISLHKGALSASEVLALYNGTLVPDSLDPNWIGHWNFESGPGNLLSQNGMRPEGFTGISGKSPLKILSGGRSGSQSYGYSAYGQPGTLFTSSGQTLSFGARASGGAFDLSGGFSISYWETNASLSLMEFGISTSGTTIGYGLADTVTSVYFSQTVTNRFVTISYTFAP